LLIRGFRDERRSRLAAGGDEAGQLHVAAGRGKRRDAVAPESLSPSQTAIPIGAEAAQAAVTHGGFGAGR